jgi:hypothetical protein
MFDIFQNVGAKFSHPIRSSNITGLSSDAEAPPTVLPDTRNTARPAARSQPRDAWPLAAKAFVLTGPNRQAG